MSFSIGGEGFDDPSDFDALVLQNLDEHLRCPICKEFFDTTMILSTCSHSFCALCIRRSLTAEQICPKCRKPASDNHLLYNYDLDHVVSTWRQSRSLLLDLDKKANAPPIKDEQEQEYPSFIAETKSLPIIRDNDKSDDFVPYNNNNTAPSNTGAAAAATRRSTRLVAQPQPHYNVKGKAPFIKSSNSSHFPNSIKLEQYQPALPNHNQQYQPDSYPYQQSEPVETEPLKSTSLVQCPICLQTMKYLVLDKHLDRCMKGDSRIPDDPSPNVSSSRSASSSLSSPMSPYTNTKMSVPSVLKKSKPIDLGRKPGKVVYAMQSDKDMRNILKELGLPDHGDKVQKIWRHKEYINLYNANYDSPNPVSANTLIQRLAVIESAFINDKNNISKRKAPDLDQHKQKYKTEFELLIEDAKRRRKETDKREPSSQIDSNNDDV